MVPAQGLKSRIGILTGPTATGKTALALELARSSRNPIEIVNADSLLVYRGMDIGTAKPNAEERARLPHHLIDIREPHETFTAGEFYRTALQAIQEIEERGNRPLIVGGTGFYLKALLFGLWAAPKADPELRALLERSENQELYVRLEKRDPESALRIGAHDRYRLIRALELIELGGKSPSELQAAAPQVPDPRFVLWVLDRPNSELQERIRLRTRKMIDDGFLDEVGRLQQSYRGQPAPRAFSSVGYAEVQAYLAGKPPEGRKLRPGLDGLLDEIELATRQLVKKQRTWFRSQKHARWFELDRELDRFRDEWNDIYETEDRAD